MMLRLSLAFACATIAAPLALAGPPTATAPLRRFALVVGSNNGGNEREHLRYAGHDAATVADVLQQLGGVNDADLSLLREPAPRDLDAAFDSLSRHVRDSRDRGQRVELVVYYSGHADETGILIGGAHYDYAHLRERIREVPADVRIAIVDSCASGSFTRMKGGHKMPPFLRDTSNQVEGFAFLSSSSADEDAQESDRIGASFFTYFFVSGLRGAADRNHDGKITLSEAYQFSYEQTLGRTQNTVHGPQHPSYDMHLSGTGDVVITDLRATDSSLVLAAKLRGHVTVVEKSGRVAVELVKEAGEALSLGLPSDTYSVYVETTGTGYAATVTLDHAAVVLDFDALHRASPEETVARGGVLVTTDDDDDSDHDHDRADSPWYRHIPAGFGGGMRVERPEPMPVVRGIASMTTAAPTFDALVTVGGTSREIHGSPVVGVAESDDFAFGATLGGTTGFAYDMSIGFGPGVFVGDNLQLGATVGFGLSGITGGILPFAWKVPAEAFAILELSPEVHPMAYFRQSYIFDSDQRKHGSSMAVWGADEAEVGAGLRFGGHLGGFCYGSMREMENVRYWGIGLGAVL
ncbi:MAG TPA: caspase family protein [Kofleriaceae bacterium]|nr:caspase family protein [Kofleriaceae bacterium]